MEKGKTVIIGLTGHIFTDQRMTRIASALSSNGYVVRLYYRKFFKYRPVKTPVEVPFETVPVVCPANSGVLLYLIFNIQLFCKILFRRVDYLYAVDSDTLPAFTLLSIIRNKPLVFDSHEYFTEVPELKGATLKKRIWNAVTRAGVRRSRLCITVGPELAGVLSKVYGKHFTAIRNVPSAIPLPEVRKAEPPVILYQGALNAGRQLELLIQAMKDLPECKCILAGEGDLSRSLREMAQGMDNVEFAGLMNPPDLRRLTLECFAGYNLLEPESLSYYYSLSNKYFDYMQAGVPSISSRLPEYLKLNAAHECGVCIDNTAEAITSTVRHWLNDKTHYRKLKENAIIAAQTLNWENEQKILLNLFKSL